MIFDEVLEPYWVGVVMLDKSRDEHMMIPR